VRFKSDKCTPDGLEGISKDVHALSLVRCCLRDNLKRKPEITGCMVVYRSPRVKCLAGGFRTGGPETGPTCGGTGLLRHGKGKMPSPPASACERDKDFSNRESVFTGN